MGLQPALLASPLLDDFVPAPSFVVEAKSAPRGAPFRYDALTLKEGVHPLIVGALCPAGAVGAHPVGRGCPAQTWDVPRASGVEQPIARPAACDRSSRAACLAGRTDVYRGGPRAGDEAWGALALPCVPALCVGEVGVGIE